MAISLTVFPRVNVTESFSESASLVPGPLPEKIISVTPDTFVPTIQITFTDLSVTVAGAYDLSLFSLNSILHLTRGSSDKYEELIEASSFSTIPTTRQVISYKPDPRSIRTVTYAIQTDLSTYSITQDVWNNYSVGRDILKDYV